MNYVVILAGGIGNRLGAHTTAIMTELGIPIYFSKGSQTNIKITTKEDLELFTGYVLAQKYKSGELKF